jgi:hypothetical protein
MEEVPSDVAENWIDQLTIKQFNEELKDVFPYIYNLVSEATKAKGLTADDILGEAGPVDDLEIGQPAETYKVQPGDTLFSIAKKFQDANFQGGDIKEAVKEIMVLNKISNPRELQVGQVLEMPYFMGSGPDGAGRGLPPGGFKKYESELEGAFEDIMGQFGEAGVTLRKPGEEPQAGDHTMDKQVAMNKQMSATAIKGTGQDLGDGFTSVEITVAGQTVKGVLDTQSGDTVVINKSIIRSPAKYILVDKNGKLQPQMKLGPMTTKAVQQAGLEEGMIKKDQKTPLGEFILSYFDRETGQFPKGETAILTMIEKDYGEKYINPAKQFIEQINNRVAEVMGQREEPQLVAQDNTDFQDMRRLAGL